MILVDFLTSPLEQFWVGNVVTLFSKIFVTNSIAMLLALGITMYKFISFVSFSYYPVHGTFMGTIVPSGWQMFCELVHKFMLGLVKQQAGLRGVRFFPILAYLFVFILFMNLFGLLPIAFTCTSQPVYTCFLGFSYFGAVFLIALFEQRLEFFKQFVPGGAIPALIVPVIVVIEVFSYFIRPVTLSVRLFANMLSGHILLHILAGFGINAFEVSIFFGVLMALIVMVICVLEFGIACLQAYVFVVLVSVYLKEALYLLH